MRADAVPEFIPTPVRENSLFRSLISSTKYVLTASSPAILASGTRTTHDILEISPEIAAEWTKLSQDFVWLNKFDYKTITTQIQPNAPTLEIPCTKANSFFESLMAKLGPEAEKLSGKTVKEETLKVFVVNFQWVSHSLIDVLTTPSGTFHPLSEAEASRVKALLHQREVLNDFLLMLLQDRKTSVVLQQHDNSILQIITKTVSMMQERLGLLAQVLDLQCTIQFFYFHFQSVAMLAAYNENKKFMKNSAFDGFKAAFEILERSLGISRSSFVFQEIYDTPIDFHENWLPWKGSCVYLATKFGKKKFSMVGVHSEPKPTLRFVNLYYLYKITQLLISRKIFVLEERTMETLASTLKCNAETLSGRLFGTKAEPALTRGPTETLLNENVICLKFIETLLSTVDDPLGVLERLGLSRYLRAVMQNHVSAAVSGEFYVLAPDIKGTEGRGGEEVFSWNGGHDYVAKVFKFVTQMKYMEYPQKSADKAIKYPMSVFADDLAIELVSSVGKGLESKNKGGILLQNYLAEYLCDVRNPVSQQLAEKVLKVIASAAFNFLGPATLEFHKHAVDKSPRKESDLVEDLRGASAGKIVALLNRIVWSDQKCANSVLEYILTWVKLRLLTEQQLFGIYKLLYQILHADSEISNEALEGILMGNGQSQQTGEQAKDLLSLGAGLAEERNRPLIAFVGIKGTLLLANELAAAYIQLSKAPSLSLVTSIILTENMLLYLHSIPGVAKTFLKAAEALNPLLEASLALTSPSGFLLQFLRSLLPASSVSPGECYAPMTVLQFVCKALNQGKRRNIMFDCFELVATFLETSSPPSLRRTNQKTLWENGAINLMLVSIEKNSE